MNHAETVALCRTIKSLCNGQTFDAYTPDAWAIVLDDIPYDDAMAAVRTIYREQGSDAQWVRRIEADDIIRQIHRTWDRRIHDGEADLIPPPDMNIRDYQQWLRESRRRLALGETPEQINGDLGQLQRRDILKLIEGGGG